MRYVPRKTTTALPNSLPAVLEGNAHPMIDFMKANGAIPNLRKREGEQQSGRTERCANLAQPTVIPVLGVAAFHASAGIAFHAKRRR